MKFLVDESTGRKLHLALLNEKHDSVFVGDLFPGALDKEVLHHAEKEKRIPITNDHDFGELIFRIRKPHSGVILLRLHEDTLRNRQKYILHA